MSAVPGLEDARPGLRPEIILGPGLAEGVRVVHHLKDPATGWYYRLGPREFFVVSRLDGQRTLLDIGHEYAATFGKRLGDQHWQQILGMLGSRRMLTGSHDEESLAALAVAAKSQSRGNRRLLLFRRPLVNPDRFFGWLEPRIRFVFSAYFVVTMLLAIVSLEAMLIGHSAGLWRAARHGLADGPVLAASILLVWLTIALHESAHGLTCKHFGGSAPEIGIIWRFPILAPYCKADDVVLFRLRRHRVYTAFAGTFAGLVALLPFGVVWAVTAPGGAAHELAAAVLIMGNGMALMNLIPFLQLDGYFMLNHALGMVNLRTESYRYCGQLIRRLLGRGPGVAGYSSRARRCYLIYGLTSAIYAVALLLRFAVIWYLLLHARIGGGGSVALLGGVLILGCLLAVRSTVRNSRRTYLAAPGATATTMRGSAAGTPRRPVAAEAGRAAVPRRSALEGTDEH